MSEIKTPPFTAEDQDGDPIYIFTSAHSIADVARWIIDMGAGDDMLYLLNEMKGNSDG